MPTNTFEHLTKLDVAKLQLRDAIMLLFHERSAVAIHTLTAAAHKILDDIAQQKGMHTIRSLPYIREENKKTWSALLNEPQNFFKHADRDPEASLDFHPEFPHFFLFDAIQTYQELTQEPLFPEARIYLFWFLHKYPEFIEYLEETEFKSNILPGLRNVGFDHNNFRMIRLMLQRWT